VIRRTACYGIQSLGDFEKEVDGGYDIASAPAEGHAFN
jgi:hypothetical protein